MNFQTILVEGMTCNHCKMNVENSLKKMEGVQNVTADPTTGKVVIEGENTRLSEAQKIVTDLGYKYKGVSED